MIAVNGLRIPAAYAALQILCWSSPASAQPGDIPTLTARVAALQQAGKHEEAAAAARELVEATTQQSGPESLEVASALDTLGSAFMQQKKWNEAAPYLQRALGIREKGLPAEHLDLATSLIRLGRIKEETYKFIDGIKLAELGLKIRERLLPSIDLDVAAALDLMAELLRGNDNHARAESYALRAIDIRREMQGPENLDYGRSLATLAGIYVDAENFRKAEPVLKQAVDILEKAGEQDAARINGLWFNLGRSRQDQGRFTEAEEAAKKSVEMRIKSDGASNESVARGYALLGEIYRSQAKYALADQELRKAIEIFSAKRGPEHSNVADTLFKLAEVQADQGHFAEAANLHKQALAIHEKESKTSRRVLYSLNSLAVIMRALGDYDEAETYAKRAVEIGRKHLEAHHKNILAASLGILAGTYLDQQRLDDGAAERLAEEALQTRRASLGDNHHELAASYNALAAINRAKGTQESYTKAEELFRQALAVRRDNLDAMHPAIASVHNSLGGLYRAWGPDKLEDAEREYKEAIEIYSKGGTVENRGLAVTLANRAALFAESKRYEEAKADIDKAQLLRRKLYGPNHSSLADGLVQLAIMDIERNKTSEAEAQLKQALGIHSELAKVGDGRPLERARVHEHLARLYINQAKHKPAYDELLLAYELKKDRDPGVASTLLLLSEAAGRSGIKDATKIAEDFRLRASLIEQASLVKRSVLYGTVRKGREAKDCLAFGNDGGSELTTGQAEITLVNDTGKVKNVYAEEDKADQLPTAEIRATRDFLCTKIANVIRDDLIAVANKRIDDAKVFRYQAIVFVHGFNSTFQDALVRTAQISHDLGFDGAVFGFSWASRGGVSSYVFDRNSATNANDNLSDFLKNVVARTTARKIHLIAHSMGSRTLLDALEKIWIQNGNVHQLRIGEIILVAPDIDNANYLRLIGKMSDLQGKFTVYASRLDRPLWLSSWLGRGATAGYVSPRDGALVVKGADTIDVSEAGKMFALNHFFNENPRLFEDMRKVVQKGDRPPDRRAPKIFFKTKRTHGEYWEFKQKGIAAAR